MIFKTKWKNGVARHLGTVENKVSTTCIRCDDFDAVKKLKLILKNNTARVNSWAPIKRLQLASVIIRNTNKYHQEYKQISRNKAIEIFT